MVRIYFGKDMNYGDSKYDYNFNFVIYYEINTLQSESKAFLGALWAQRAQSAPKERKRKQKYSQRHKAMEKRRRERQKQERKKERKKERKSKRMKGRKEERDG